MFGYVLADASGLSPGQKVRYKSCYCGLCRALGRGFGQPSRLTLNYDLSFLALVLETVYGEGAEGSGRCLTHPFSDAPYLDSWVCDYAAAMNIALCYYNRLDDWEDDRNPLAFAAAGMLAQKSRVVGEKYPRQCDIIKKSLEQLGRLEADDCRDPDATSACFGRLMAALFAPREDQKAPSLKGFGYALGRFIYLLDACLDLRGDIHRGRYNPLAGCTSADFDDILELLMAEVVAAYEALGVERDELIENILFSGIMLRYDLFKKRQQRKR